MTYICTLKVKSKKMDNQIKRGEKRWGNQEWVIQRHWQHWVHEAKTNKGKITTQKAKKMSNTDPNKTRW